MSLERHKQVPSWFVILRCSNWINVPNGIGEGGYNRICKDLIQSFRRSLDIA